MSEKLITTIESNENNKNTPKKGISKYKPTVKKKSYNTQKQQENADSYLQQKILTIGDTPLNINNSCRLQMEPFLEYKVISKKQAFDILKNYLTENKLKEIAQKRENDSFYIDPDINKSWTISFYLDFLAQPENQNLLNIVVENWLFDIYWTCPNENKIIKLKEIYKKNKIEKVKEIIKTYKTKNWETLDINKIFNSKNCDPLNLENKLGWLVDENWNPISKEQINQILKGVLQVKKVKTEDKLEANLWYKKK